MDWRNVGFDFFVAAFDQVQGDAGGFAVLQGDGGFVYRVEFFERE